MRAHASLPPIVAAALAACSSSGSSGSGTLSGTVDDVSFTVGSQIAYTSVLDPSDNSGQILTIALNNRSDITCNIGPNQAFANLDALNLSAFTSSGDVTAGTYQVVPDGASADAGAGPSFTTTDGQCSFVVEDVATSGAVTISSLTSSRVSGTFNLTFGSNGSFSGSFDAPLCTALSESSDASVEAVDAGTVCEP